MHLFSCRGCQSRLRCGESSLARRQRVGPAVWLECVCWRGTVLLSDVRLLTATSPAANTQDVPHPAGRGTEGRAGTEREERRSPSADDESADEDDEENHAAHHRHQQHRGVGPVANNGSRDCGRKEGEMAEERTERDGGREKRNGGRSDKEPSKYNLCFLERQ